MIVRQRLIWQACLAAGVLVCSAIGSGASASVFDSQGFESPAYSNGAIAGQGSWQTIGDGLGSAEVSGSVVSSGSSALRVNRAGNSDDRWAPTITELEFPGPVLVQWDMYVVESGNPGFGPYFGIEMYDDNSSGSLAGLVGAFFVDSATGDLLYDDAGGFGVTGQVTAFNQWNTYSILLDFQAGTCTLGFNGAALRSVAIADGPGLTELSAVEIIALGDLDSPAVPGVAYFDNMTVSASVMLPGDTDGDGDIDDADLGTAFSNFTGPVGTAGGKTTAQGDTDSDGDVDDADLANAFSGFTGPLGPATVPEPNSLAVLGLAAFFLTRHRTHLTSIGPRSGGRRANYSTY